VAHSSHLSQPWDLCVFGVLKIADTKGNKVKEMKEEILTMSRAITAFAKATVIPMVRWSFIRGGFGLNPADLLAPLTVNPAMIARDNETSSVDGSICS
jgi:hypothetical protein